MRRSLNMRLIPAVLAAMAFILGPAAAAKAEDAPAPIAQAVASEARPEADRARDADRKPAKVLAFFGVKPGMTVLDLNSGGGYYTEILSRVLGENGKIYAHNDDLFWRFVKDKVGERYDGRLENVTRIQVNIPDLEIEPESVDVALLILAFHDFYYTPESRPEAVDVPAALARIKAALKPGGVFGVIDHSANPGSPPETGHSLHRIDEALLKRRVLDAGFVLDEEADFLRNPQDDRTQSPFTEGLRGKTDRFVLRFKKPE